MLQTNVCMKTDMRAKTEDVQVGHETTFDLHTFKRYWNHFSILV
jgi:hypothetical protein